MNEAVPLWEESRSFSVQEPLCTSAGNVQCTVTIVYFCRQCTVTMEYFCRQCTVYMNHCVFKQVVYSVQGPLSTSAGSVQCTGTIVYLSRQCTVTIEYFCRQCTVYRDHCVFKQVVYSVQGPLCTSSGSVQCTGTIVYLSRQCTVYCTSAGSVQGPLFTSACSVQTIVYFCRQCKVYRDHCVPMQQVLYIVKKLQCTSACSVQCTVLQGICASGVHSILLLQVVYSNLYFCRQCTVHSIIGYLCKWCTQYITYAGSVQRLLCTSKGSCRDYCVLLLVVYRNRCVLLQVQCTLHSIVQFCSKCTVYCIVQYTSAGNVQ